MSHAQFQSVNYLQQQPVPLRQGRGAGSLGTSGLGSTVAPLAQNNSFCSHDYIRLIMMTSKTTTEEYIYILWSFLSFFFFNFNLLLLYRQAPLSEFFFFLQQSLFCYMDNIRLTWLRPQTQLGTGWLSFCCFPPSRSKSAPQSQDKSGKSDENPLKQYWILFSKCIKLHKFKHWLKGTWFCF